MQAIPHFVSITQISLSRRVCKLCSYSLNRSLADLLRPLLG